MPHTRPTESCSQVVPFQSKAYRVERQRLSRPLRYINDSRIYKYTHKHLYNFKRHFTYNMYLQIFTCTCKKKIGYILHFIYYWFILWYYRIFYVLHILCTFNVSE
jgi:hypothetical protein